MDNTVLVALISSGGSVLVAVTALLLSYRGFASIDSRFASLDARFASLERRLERLEDELRTFKELVSGKFAALDLELARLMDRGS